MARPHGSTPPTPPAQRSLPVQRDQVEQFKQVEPRRLRIARRLGRDSPPGESPLSAPNEPADRVPLRLPAPAATISGRRSIGVRYSYSFASPFVFTAFHLRCVVSEPIRAFRFVRQGCRLPPLSRRRRPSSRWFAPSQACRPLARLADGLDLLFDQPQYVRGRFKTEGKRQQGCTWGCTNIAGASGPPIITLVVPCFAGIAVGHDFPSIALVRL